MVTEWVWTQEQKLMEKKPILPPSPSDEATMRLADGICGWRMAEQAGLVICLDSSGRVFRLTCRGLERIGAYTASRIVCVSPKGTRALIQTRSDMMQIDTKTGKVEKVLKNCGVQILTKTT